MQFLGSVSGLDPRSAGRLAAEHDQQSYIVDSPGDDTGGFSAKNLGELTELILSALVRACAEFYKMARVITQDVSQKNQRTSFRAKSLVIRFVERFVTASRRRTHAATNTDVKEPHANPCRAKNTAKKGNYIKHLTTTPRQYRVVGNTVEVLV